MFKRITYRTFFFVAITMVAFGCKSNSVAPTVETPRTPGEFGYSVNGVSYDQKNFQTAFAYASIEIDDNFFYTYPKDLNGLKVLQIPLTILADSVTQYVEIFIPISSPTPRTYPFISSGSNGAYAYMNSPNVFTYSSNGVGSITITKFDTLNNLISGTFSFDGSLTYPNSDPSKIIHLTSGYFNDIPIDIGSFGQGTISATIDGETFSTASGSSSSYISAQSNHNNLGISAQDGSSGKAKNLGFDIFSFKEGIYILNNGLQDSGVSAGFSKYIDSARVDMGIGSGWQGPKNATGTFTITKIDTVSHRLSARFDFSGFDTTIGKTVHVTNGVIDNVRWINQYW